MYPPKTVMEYHNILQFLVDTLAVILMLLTTMNAVNEDQREYLLMQLIPFIITFAHILLYEKRCNKYILLSLGNYLIGSMLNIIWFIVGFEVKNRARYYDTYMFLAFIYYVHWMIGVVCIVNGMKSKKKEESKPTVQSFVS